MAVNRAAAFNVAARWLLHDLRSPAQSLTLMADLVDEPTENLQQVVRAACGHLARSLDLLARVVHPSPPGEAGPISVQEAIAFVTDVLQAGRTQVRVELAVDAALPAAVGTARHLEHALLNLILYATDALRAQNGGTIRITGRSEGDRVVIALGWDGPPVAPELAGRLFELPPDLATADQPLGFGLPVAHEVIRLSGGTLTYAPDHRPAPRFLISLPGWPRVAPPPPAGSP